MHKLTAFIGDNEYYFEFIAYKDPAELDIHEANMRLPEHLDAFGEWHNTNLTAAEEERLIWENQAAWVEMPTAAQIETANFWAEKPKDTAKEKQIY